jgi:hypothetical protein
MSMRCEDIFHPEEGDHHPTAVAHTMFMDRIDHGVATTVFEFLQASVAPMRVT